MKSIDIHTHLMPPSMPDFKSRFGYTGFMTLRHHDCGADMIKDTGEFFRRVEKSLFEPNLRIKDVDAYTARQKIGGMQVLSTIPVLFSYFAKPSDGLEVAKFLNDHMAGVVAEHPNRFYGLGTIPLQDPDLAIHELERCVRGLGLSGVEIGSHVGERNLNDPGLFAVFEAAADLGAAVFVHPWDMVGKAEMPDYWLPWLIGMPFETARAIAYMLFGGVFERLPKLRVAFAHGGGGFPMSLGRISHGYEVRPDLCAKDNQVHPREYAGRFFVDSLVHDLRTLEFVRDVLGEDSICLGSDYPFVLGERDPLARIEKTDKSFFEKIISRNPRRWLLNEE